jgi:hypothetical protein
MDGRCPPPHGITGGMNTINSSWWERQETGPLTGDHGENGVWRGGLLRAVGEDLARLVVGKRLEGAWALGCFGAVDRVDFVDGMDGMDEGLLLAKGTKGHEKTREGTKRHENAQNFEGVFSWQAGWRTTASRLNCPKGLPLSRRISPYLGVSRSVSPFREYFFPGVLARRTAGGLWKSWMGWAAWGWRFGLSNRRGWGGGLEKARAIFRLSSAVFGCIRLYSHFSGVFFCVLAQMSIMGAARTDTDGHGLTRTDTDGHGRGMRVERPRLEGQGFFGVFWLLGAGEWESMASHGCMV